MIILYETKNKILKWMLFGFMISGKKKRRNKKCAYRKAKF